LISRRPFSIDPLEPSLISNGFRDIQWRVWRNGWHDLKRPLNNWSRSFIFVPIDFSYTSYYKLSIVTFVGRTI